MRVSPTVLAFTLIAAIAAPLRAESIYALTNNDPAVGQRLVTFESTTGVVSSTVLLQTASTLSPLANIDVRPATGQLYGFDAAALQLYRINPGSGALIAVGAPLPAGTVVGGEIDFNPAVDLIRLVGANGENLRLNPTTGAIAGTDTPLAYQTGDANQGDAPNVRGAGYTNSFAGAGTTTLFGIDVSNDVLVKQDPANSGQLETIGALGVDLNAGLFGTFTGFDISGSSDTAYLTDSAFAGASNLYSVDLTTGVASSLGTVTGLPAGRSVADIAVAFPAVPEPTTLALFAAACVAVGAVSRRTRR